MLNMGCNSDFNENLDLVIRDTSHVHILMRKSNPVMSLYLGSDDYLI